MDPWWLIAPVFPTAAVSVAFIYYYARETWFRSQFGQSVMVMAVALLLLSVFSLLYYFLGPNYPWRDVLLFTARLLILGALSQRLFVLIRAQHRR